MPTAGAIPVRPCGWPSPPTTTRIRGTARSSPAWAPPAKSWPSSHSFAFFNRDPLPAYGSNPFSEFYRRLTALRHANPALASGERGGEMIEIRNNAEDCLMIAVREAEGNRVVAVMNLSPYAIHADYYTGIYAGMYTDAMTGRPGELRGHVEEDMAPWSYRILTR